MAFMCKGCVPAEAEKMFTMFGMMGVSHGPCESCGRVTDCIDWHGRSRDKDEPPTEPVGDWDRYADKEDFTVLEDGTRVPR